MGLRGPRPTPTPVLRLRGSSLATRRRSRNEPAPAPGAPDPPDWLDEPARAAWDQLVPQLEAMQVLTRIDGHALARYCALWSRWRSAEAFIARHGETYPIKDESGRIKCLQQFPQVSIANRLAVQLTRLEQEFGMTPSARNRINVQVTQSPVDPLAELLAHG